MTRPDLCESCGGSLRWEKRHPGGSQRATCARCRKVTYCQPGGHMSLPAGVVLRSLRQKAHRLIERRWGRKTQEAFRFCQLTTGEGHIGRMTEEQASRLIRALQNLPAIENGELLP